jgi:transmembrane sensor
MSAPSFKDLLHKYNSGTCTPEERAMIESWYQQMELPDVSALTDNQLEEIEGMQPTVEAPRKVRTLYPWLSAAAAVLLIIGGVFYSTQRPNQHPAQSVKLHNDAFPGSNKAILTLANGKKIVLNGTQSAKLTQQGNVIVATRANGQLLYESTANEPATQATATLFNIVTTPRGGQYHLVLADGSNIWLNAESSIKYPTVFNSTERRVEITGEAYFEVAHNPKKPFRVICNGQTVEVLGTHFNINAYSDEPALKTTLLQGSVKVTSASLKNTAILKPGQQAVLYTGKQFKVSETDAEAAIDWKEGDFVFKNQTLPDIMRKIARWYDVDVNYGIYQHSKITFSGEVSRTQKLSAVLKMLEVTAPVKFNIHDNLVSITDKN